MIERRARSADLAGVVDEALECDVAWVDFDLEVGRRVIESTVDECLHYFILSEASVSW